MMDQQIKQEIIHGIRQYLNGDHPLESHQLDALHDAVDHLDRPIPKSENATANSKQFDGGSIKMATGSGKTYAELAVAIGAGKKTLIISPYIRLNTQIADTYTMAEKLGFSHDDIVIYDSEERENYPLNDKTRAGDAKILITTDAGFRSLHDEGIISSDPTAHGYRPVVLLDESDTLIGPVTKNLLREDYVPNCVTLGFSATDDGVSEALFDGQPRIHELSSRNAITRGILNYGVHTAAIEVHPGNFTMADHHVRRGEDFSEEVADDFAKGQDVIDEAIRFHATYDDKDDPKHGKIGIGPIRRFPTLVTVPRIQTAKDYAANFNRYFGDGYAVGVSGETPHEDSVDTETGKIVPGLNTLLKRHNNGEMPRVIVFPEVLGRGTDISNATVMISTRPHKKLGPVEQYLGRVLRRGDDDYIDRYGNDKIALAVNIFTPEMKPILFSQAIGGPILYSNKKPRKNDVQPAVEPALEHLPAASGEIIPGTEQPESVITDIGKLEILYRDAELARMEREGIVPKGWITFDEAVEAIGIVPSKLNRFISKIEPGEHYTILGRKADSAGVPGHLSNDYPAESLVMNMRGKRLLNAEMVGRLASIQRRIEERHGPEAGTAIDVARENRVPVAAVKRAEAYTPRHNIRAIEQFGGPLPKDSFRR